VYHPPYGSTPALVPTASQAQSFTTSPSALGVFVMHLILCMSLVCEHNPRVSEIVVVRRAQVKSLCRFSTDPAELKLHMVEFRQSPVEFSHLGNFYRRSLFQHSRRFEEGLSASCKRCSSLFALVIIYYDML
jgi:hypothetical protein